MSQYTTRATHPETGELHLCRYGWDEVPGFRPGYFFQVDDNKDPDKTIVNEGMLVGLTEAELERLAKKWKVKLKRIEKAVT